MRTACVRMTRKLGCDRDDGVTNVYADYEFTHHVRGEAERRAAHHRLVREARRAAGAGSRIGPLRRAVIGWITGA
jgi:hypothetical protein